MKTAPTAFQEGGQVARCAVGDEAVRVLDLRHIGSEEGREGGVVGPVFDGLEVAARGL